MLRPVVIDYCDNVLYGMLALLDLRDFALNAIRHHDSVFNYYCLLNCSENISRNDFLADLYLRGEVPLFAAVNCWDADSS